MSKTFTDSAKVMTKGQITIPKDIRRILGVKPGDRVTFVVDGARVMLVNTAVSALRLFQEQMKGEAAQAGLPDEDSVMKLVEEIRYQDGGS